MDAAFFVSLLKQHGVTFFTGVPDSYLHGFCSELKKTVSRSNNIIAANEGNAVAIAVGHYLATQSTPLVYMQNSGLGNAINPLVSLACKPMLGIPMVLLIGWRGDPWNTDHVQHKLQGEITPKLLDDAGIAYKVLSDDKDLTRIVSWATDQAHSASNPVALLVPKGILNGIKVPMRDTVYPLSREEAIKAVLNAVPINSIICATTGRASRELYNLREMRGESHKNDYLNVGSMGHASSVALGIASGNSKRRVICLDGDAAAVMHMGAMAINPTVGVRNLSHVVLNNGVHESVGGQPSVGWTVNLTAIAKACGYATIEGPVSTEDDITHAFRMLMRIDAPTFLDIRIHSGIRPEMPGLEVDPLSMRNELIGELSS